MQSRSVVRPTNHAVPNPNPNHLLLAEEFFRGLPEADLLPANTEQVEFMKGPLLDDEQECQRFLESATPYCCGTSISTYPRAMNPEQRGIKKEGDPICDQFEVAIFPSRLISVIADGCNWGERPRIGAKIACEAFTEYLIQSIPRITTIQSAGCHILQAMSQAHLAITDQFADSPSTAILGGILVEINRALPNGCINDDPPFGFVYGSLGDCGGFHWNSRTCIWRNW